MVSNVNVHNAQRTQIAKAFRKKDQKKLLGPEMESSRSKKSRQSGQVQRASSRSKNLGRAGKFTGQVRGQKILRRTMSGHSSVQVSRLKFPNVTQQET